MLEMASAIVITIFQQSFDEPGHRDSGATDYRLTVD
jgi:hypothetical protein